MTSYTHPLLVPVAIGILIGTAAVVGVEDARDASSTAFASAPVHSAPNPTVDPSATHVPYGADLGRLSVATFDETVETYCVRCHSDRRLRGNLSLEDFSLETAPGQGEVAEKMIRKLRAGMMPPASARRPSADSLAALVSALETRMDEAAAADPNPGSRTFQRLNRAEYTAAVEDLLGVTVDVDAFLPTDTKSANFDNIADVQTPSATQMEGYLRAAAHVARVTLGDPDADATSTTYRVPRTASQKDRAPGAPFGTRGGMAQIHNFPADGQYVFRVMLHAAPEGELFGRRQTGEQVEVSIDGERVAILDVDRWMSESDPTGMTLTTDSVHVRAGARTVAVAFVQQFQGPVDDLITPQDHTLADTQIGLDYGITTLPHLSNFSIVGPFSVTGVSDFASRAAVFTCRPTAPDEAQPCAETILTRIAETAYRRPLEADESEALTSFYELGAETDGFEGGVRLALQAILASPHFVFRTEKIPSGTAPGSVYRVTDMDLASRLSFFLWGSVPDAELVEVARAGDLSDAEVLEQQVARMLADPRSEALATRFAAQWLRLPDLEKVHPDALDYPYFDQTLAEAMQRETELLFDHLVREDRSALDILTADYTFVNERLARHYEIPNVTGPEFRRVAYADDRRRGILGHGSVLTLTSHADRTSPVLRGKWVMEVLLGSPPPPPPPDVPGLEETQGVEEGRVLTVRERQEIHRANPSCASCHNVIDPIGLALENYDVTGAYRVKDGGNAIDPAGELYDGSPISGPSDLRAAILSRPEVFLRNFTENLMAYGLGRRLEYYDMPTVRSITRDAAENDYRMSSFIRGVVHSIQFQTNQVAAAADAEAGR